MLKIPWPTIWNCHNKEKIHGKMWHSIRGWSHSGWLPQSVSQQVKTGWQKFEIYTPSNITRNKSFCPSQSSYLCRVLHLSAGCCKVNCMHETINLFTCNFAKHSPITIFFTVKFNNSFIVKQQLNSPSHLKCIATLPCDLSLRTICVSHSHYFLTSIFHWNI